MCNHNQFINLAWIISSKKVYVQDCSNCMDTPPLQMLKARLDGAPRKLA